MELDDIVDNKDINSAVLEKLGDVSININPCIGELSSEIFELTLPDTSCSSESIEQEIILGLDSKQLLETRFFHAKEEILQSILEIRLSKSFNIFQISD